jgi:hypothetical protein
MARRGLSRERNSGRRTDAEIHVFDRVPTGVSPDNVEVKRFTSRASLPTTNRAHIHQNAHEITIVRSGCARQVYLHREYLGTEGEFLCPRNVPHLAHGVKREPSDIIVLQFEETFVALIPERGSYLAPFSVMQPRLDLRIPGATETARRISDTARTLANAPYSDTLLRRAYLLQIPAHIHAFYEEQIGTLA